MSIIKKAAAVGGGVIGAGWVARLLENGIDVAVYDPAPEAGRRLQAVLDNAEHAYAKLTLAPRRAKGRLTFAASIAEAVKNAELIVESVPERLDVKQTVYAEVETAALPTALIASSTSGILPTELQAKMMLPERLLVAHPFNPVYLLPLVELVGGAKTAPVTIERAKAIYTALGMHPLHIKKEIEAFVADRLLEAVWRECLWLVTDGIATTAEIDDAIRYGFGLRWAQMGIFETYRIAGGEAGMRHFMAQFGPCLKWPWTKLTDVPEFNDELVDLVASQSDAQSGAYSIRELERIRDDNLIAILQALKVKDWGAGKALAAYERALVDAAGAKAEDYVANGGSYFTVETHIRHLDEVAALEPVKATTQVLAAGGKKLHLFHRLYHADGRLLATGEHMLIHVSLKTRSAADPAPAIAAKAAELAAAHAGLERPEGAGRAIGQAR